MEISLPNVDLGRKSRLVDIDKISRQSRTNTTTFKLLSQRINTEMTELEDDDFQEHDQYYNKGASNHSTNRRKKFIDFKSEITYLDPQLLLTKESNFSKFQKYKLKINLDTMKSMLHNNKSYQQSFMENAQTSRNQSRSISHTSNVSPRMKVTHQLGNLGETTLSNFNYRKQNLDFYRKQIGKFMNCKEEDFDFKHKLTVTESWKPPNRELAGFCQDKDNLYVNGGISNKILEDLVRYNFQTQSWHVLGQKSNGKIARYAHAMCLNKRSIFVFGGVSKITRKEILGDTWEYNLDTEEWTQIKVIGQEQEPRFSTAHIRYDKFFVIHGGKNNKYQIQDTVQVLNMETKKWVEIGTKNKTKLQAYLHQATAISKFNHDKKIFFQQDIRFEGIYYFGGITKINEEERCQNKILIQHLNDKGVPIGMTTPDISGKGPCGRHSHGQFKINSIFLAIMGGLNYQNKVLDDLFLLNLLSMSWIHFINPLFKRSRTMYHSQNDAVTLFGGWDHEGLQDLNPLEIESDKKRIKARTREQLLLAQQADRFSIIKKAVKRVTYIRKEQEYLEAQK